ncbi:MAG: DEAD/DEAH box helicase family protein [Gammaproteobacteria bacterium]|jgi:superfamily II DNA or RNA helicase|nr:DEAD/DEAH box helicase family protein [Gammaproteobacteria bacterium]MBT5825457.1 DEAD/DEAH box helicase family protein [Gammaproteobacteria bacterium]
MKKPCTLRKVNRAFKPTKPREYQQSFIDDITKAVMSGYKRIVACASTGAGKSIVLAIIAQRALNKNKRVIIILPRRSLVIQLSETFTNFGITQGIVMAGEPEYRSARCQIVSVDTYMERLASGRMQIIQADSVESFNGAYSAIIYP